jgi:hypothetical protein
LVFRRVNGTGERRRPPSLLRGGPGKSDVSRRRPPPTPLLRGAQGMGWLPWKRWGHSHGPQDFRQNAELTSRASSCRSVAGAIRKGDSGLRLREMGSRGWSSTLSSGRYGSGMGMGWGNPRKRVEPRYRGAPEDRDRDTARSSGQTQITIRPRGIPNDIGLAKREKSRERWARMRPLRSLSRRNPPDNPGSRGGHRGTGWRSSLSMPSQTESLRSSTAASEV